MKGTHGNKILEIHSCKSHVVETDRGEYERCSADNWYKRMGESLEPVYFTDELENLFQEFITLTVQRAK